MNDDQHQQLTSWLATIDSKIEAVGQLYDDLAKRLSDLNSILREIEWLLIAITAILIWKLVF